MIDLKSELAVFKGVRSFRRLSEVTGLPASYLCDAMKGHRPPSAKLLKMLGLRKVVNVSYERIGSIRDPGSSGKARKRNGAGGISA